MIKNNINNFKVGEKVNWYGNFSIRKDDFNEVEYEKDLDKYIEGKLSLEQFKSKYFNGKKYKRGISKIVKIEKIANNKYTIVSLSNGVNACLEKNNIRIKHYGK